MIDNPPPLLPFLGTHIQTFRLFLARQTQGGKETGGASLAGGLGSSGWGWRAQLGCRGRNPDESSLLHPS